MSVQESGPGLASVIGPPFLEDWKAQALDNSLPLARFHAKFWGRSMADEEQNRLTAIGGELGSGRQGNQSVDKDMDVTMDDGERTDMDDIKPGCYLLDIGLEGIEHSKIWIRADYIRIYDHLEKYYGELAQPCQRAPGAILTGQPGIGKSVWIYYALRRRLAERKPVILYYREKCYLFADEGVFTKPPSFTPGDFTAIVWTLVDSDTEAKGVPSHLIAHGTRLFVIYATSPRRERWSRMHKTVRATTVIMNPWTMREILHAAPAMLPASVQHDQIEDIFDTLGPTPRLCFEYFAIPHALTVYKEELQNMITNITATQLERLCKDAAHLSMDDIFHKICLISRKDREDMYSGPSVAPITPSVQSRLANQLRKLDHKEKVRLYKLFAKQPALRSVSGCTFESIGQEKVQNGIALVLIPMVHLPETNRGSPQWYSSNAPLSNESLESSRQEALQRVLHVAFHPTETVEYDDPPSIVSGVYYVPEADNQVALDSFILLGGLLYILQFTIGGSHKIKPGLIPFLQECRGLPAMHNWRFVFLVPAERTVICPRPNHPELWGLEPYCAVMEM